MEALTNESFKTKVFDYENNKTWSFKGEKPAIIDFYADWCGPCKRLSPVLEELSQTYSEKIDVYKINVDTEAELASAFGVMSVPTILFIPKDSEPQMAQGALPKEVLEQAISEVLLGEAPQMMAGGGCCGGGCHSASESMGAGNESEMTAGGGCGSSSSASMMSSDDDEGGCCGGGCHS